MNFSTAIAEGEYRALASGRARAFDVGALIAKGLIEYGALARASFGRRWPGLFPDMLDTMRFPGQRVADRDQSPALSLPSYRPDIDGLRAIAVLLVIGFHTFPKAARGGFIGVDLFFVISGYLISTILFTNVSNGGFSFADFYARRIRRIFPALAIVLIAGFAFGWFWLLPDELKSFGRHLLGGAGFLSNFLLWAESGYFDTAADLKPLLHLWSLGIEEQFYVMWPLFLWVAWKCRLNLLTLTIVVATVSFAVNLAQYRTDSVADFYSPLARFWELLIGSVVAYIHLFGHSYQTCLRAKFDKLLDRFASLSSGMRDSITRNGPAIVGGLLIVLAGVLITKTKHFPGIWAVLPTVGAALIISSDPRSWVNRSLMSNRFLVGIGLISYPLYLWHWPLLCFARIIEQDTPRVGIRLATVAGAIVLALLTYELIEKPFRFGRYLKAKTVLIVMLMGTIAYIGYATYLHEGFPSRYPALARDIFAPYSFAGDYRQGTCFLNPDNDYTKFQDCGVTRDNNKKTILIWGDSHAAHLYPGFNEKFGSEFNLIQRTAGGCPPIIDLEVANLRHCKTINDKTFELIQREMPDKVVLAAFWIAYDWRQIRRTVQRLNALGVNNIYLVGPVPAWNNSLPKELHLYFARFGYVPTALPVSRTQILFGVDEKLKKLAEELQIAYLSPLTVLCSHESCLTRAGDAVDSLIAWDQSHLTRKGSIYLVDHLFSEDRRSFQAAEVNAY